MLAVLLQGLGAISHLAPSWPGRGDAELVHCSLTRPVELAFQPRALVVASRPPSATSTGDSSLSHRCFVLTEIWSEAEGE